MNRSHIISLFIGFAILSFVLIFLNSMNVSWTGYLFWGAVAVTGCLAVAIQYGAHKCSREDLLNEYLSKSGVEILQFPLFSQIKKWMVGESEDFKNTEDEDCGCK